MKTILKIHEMKLNELTKEEIEIKKFAKKLEVLYELFNWEWVDYHIPNAEKIEENIYYLINRAIKIRMEDKTECVGVGSGGITVDIDEFDNLNIKWTLEKSLYLQLTNKLTEKKV